LAQAKQQLAQRQTQNLLDQTVHVNGVAVLAVQIDAADADTMRQMTDWLRDKLGSSVVVVGSVIDGRPQIVAAVTPDLTQRGMHAGNLVKSIAPLMDGRGGGAPHMAQAGGKDGQKLPEALRRVPSWVEENLR